ncbi:hypothetical protein SAMN05192553_106167 [Cyclobacterium xiamenense]|uniref:Uncharacterized protein n=1 Tax=Cyclobacterium xiamenense TaxID=1297121 RepID=A0A1H7AKZ6_9BACT|nr:hypothetical protein SAMN05192553_106167 [Cyclobacterium xiamenense]
MCQPEKYPFTREERFRRQLRHELGVGFLSRKAGCRLDGKHVRKFQ